MANSPTKSRPVGNPREQWRGRLALATPDEMASSFASSLQRIAERRRVPDGFQCPKCLYLKATKRHQFRVWAQKHRPDVLNESIHCRCADTAEEIERQALIRFTAANLPGRTDVIGPRSFGNFSHLPETLEMIRKVRSSVGARPGDGAPMLVLIGVTGCGKTHLMEAAAREELHRGRRIRYEVAGDFLDRLRATFDDDGEQGIHSLLGWYKAMPVLYLDDLGMQSATPWGAGYLTNLIEHRLAAGSPTMVTTNIKTPEEMAVAWGERLASRIFDRHSGSVERVYCAAEDYRLHGGGK